MRSQLAVIGAVARSADLRRLEAGFLVFSVGEWASWLALLVFAYDRGGAAEAGVIGFLMALPAIVVSPAAAIFGDRWPRARVLLGSYALQAVAMVATAMALMGGPAWLAYALAIIGHTCISLTRPAFSALLPEVVEAPDELTAANVVSGMAEGAGSLIGPVLAGILLVAAGPPLVFVVTAGGALFAALALWPIARRPPVVAQPAETGAGETGGEASGARASGATARSSSVLTAMVRDVAHELTAGAAAIRADRRLAGIVTVQAAAIGLLGAMGVFTVVIAIDLLGLDDGAVGLLSAASGLGALLGSAAAVILVGRERLGRPLLVSAASFGVSVALVGVVREEAVVIGAFVIGGVGWSFAYVAATTLTQRLAGDDVMTRVFGVTESVMSGPRRSAPCSSRS